MKVMFRGMESDKKAEKYIEKEISICEHFKVSAQSRINYFNEEIERFKNLSDEEYEKILVAHGILLKKKEIVAGVEENISS